MSELTTIARPYAKAVFDFAVEKEALEQWSQMLTFAAEVAKNKDMAELLTGSVSVSKLAEIFVTICGDQVDEYGQNLIKVMAENGRLKVIPEVCNEFLVLKQEHEKIMDADIISASKLSKKQLADISSKLEKRLEHKVNLNCSVDETLLGGVIIRVGDLVIDNSTRGQLDRLSDALKS